MSIKDPWSGTGPHRSVLSVPASDTRKMVKALASAADEVVLDLEDSVAVGEKDRARELLITALQSLAQDERRRLAVRVNPPGSPWCHLDLLAVGALSHPGLTVVVPKVESAGDLAFVDRLLDGVSARTGNVSPLRIQALIETAAGLIRLPEIATASPRLDALILGYADLGASLGMTSRPEARLELWLPVQQALLVAARSAGVAAVDGPYLGVDVDEAFTGAARRARDLGFDGKWAIHPQQLDALNEIFTPGPDEVRHAHDVLAEMARGAATGAGAVLLNGQMLDEAVAATARRVLARVPRQSL